MSKFMKALGFLGIWATASDMFGHAAFLSTRPTPSNIETETVNVISEDSRPTRTRRSRPVKAAEAETAKKTPNGEPASPLTQGSRLFRDIVAEREFFMRFSFSGCEGDILCSVNREVESGKNAVGLLLLEPSGILKTLVIDRSTLAVLHNSASIPRKELREELAENGVLVSDARLIASQVAGFREERKSVEGHSSEYKALLENPGHSRKFSVAQRDEILERFRRDVSVNKYLKQQEATK